MKKKLALLVSAVIMGTMVMTGCGNSNNASTTPNTPAVETNTSSETIVLKMGTTVNEQDSFQVVAEKFAEIVAEKTDNAYNIEIYPNASLGDERTMLESMQMGTLDMGIITSGPFVNFIPEMGVFDMPFLFASNEEAYKIFDGEIGKEILDKFEDANLKGLAYAERGFRNLSNNVKEVNTAEDMAGLKIRVMQNEIYISTFETLGVNAVPMAWTEALTALQQKTIDGQENPVNVIHSHKLWESQGYLTMTRHAYAPAIVTMSLNKFNSLPEDVQTIFLEAAQEAAEFERAWVAENEEQQLKDIAENGVIIVENPDLQSFKDAVIPVYEKYSQYDDYVERIKAELN